MTKLLVVDDNRADRLIAGACAETLGCSVSYAVDGEQALEHIERDLPDIVLTDLQMPVIDGLSLVRHVRAQYPSVPVILMTAFGSEEIAAEALRAGAANYVPKRDLQTTLPYALKSVLAAIVVTQAGVRVRRLLVDSETRFVLDYEPGAPHALVSYLQDGLTRLNFCDQTALFQINTALTEAITNAIDHGNLELDSALRESPDAYQDLGFERSRRAPFCERRVYVTATLTAVEVKYVIRDDGQGYDPALLPDPTDPENLLKPSGRGIMLIRTFMDEVRFNDRGNEITMVKRLQK